MTKNVRCNQVLVVTIQNYSRNYNNQLEALRDIIAIKGVFVTIIVLFG